MSMLAFCAPAWSDWDVTDTGQPFTEAKFTVTEGTWMDVDVSPDGKTLVFDLLGDIYSIPASGGDAKLIHGGPALEYSPRFSPDGQKLLYFSDRVGADNLWVSNIDGSGARQITQETSSALTTLAWGPQGDCVVASKFGSDTSRYKASEIWLYHLDGGKGRLLVETPKNNMAVLEPELSHDGRYLYYTENITAHQSSFVFADALQPIYAIKRRDLSNGKAEELVSGFGGATTAQISPDDGRIAFIRRVKAKTVLFVYDLRTGEQRPVYDGLDRGLHGSYVPRAGSYYPQYAWFPDGHHVAIWSGGKIYRIDVDTQVREEIPFRVATEQRITVPPRFENPLAPEQFTVRAIQQIAPTPDGKSIAFNALGHLWQKSLPDGKPQRLTQDSAFEFEPSYSADGASLAYVSWDDEKGGALELMNVKGRQVKTMVKGVGIIRQPTFSADGKRLVYWLQRGNARIGGYRTIEPGIYWLSVTEGRPHYVGPVHGKSDKHPQFSPDGQRIYYATEDKGGSGPTNVIESVNLDGLDKRQHVTTGQMSELRISPDLNWLAYKMNLQYYVIPYREIGAPINLTKAGQELPATQLTEYPSFEIAWSADAKRVSWVLGSTLYSAAIAGRPSADVKPVVTQTTIGLEVPADKPQGVVAFTNGRIITMHAERVIEHGTLVVEGNRIVAVGPADRVEVPKAAKVIDVTGKTLMPGLVDMHGHVWTKNLLPQKQPNHYALLAFGVTTNFDPSNGEIPGYATTEMTLAGVTVGPRFISTGQTIYGLDEARASNFHPIKDFEDARKIIAYKKAEGGVIVKSYTQPMRSQRQQLIKAARESGLMVTPEGEGNFYHNLTMLLDGHVSVEHNMPLANYYDDLVQLIAHGGTSLTPTLVVTLGDTWAENYFYQTTRLWDDPKVGTYIQTTASFSSPLGSAPDAPPYVRGMVGLHQAEELWDMSMRSVSRALKKVDDAGGVVNIGAHGILQGLGTHWEMWALAEGGMSNLHVLRAGTLNGAKTLGLDKQIGTLEAGKLADLLVLDANPLENIRNTNTVRYTMVNGRLYDSLTMNEIGNYNRPRSKFFWELESYKGIDWNEAWAGIDGDDAWGSPGDSEEQ
jgi:Tol biopolymer transport system component